MGNTQRLFLLNSGRRAKSAMTPGPQTEVMPEEFVGDGRDERGVEVVLSTGIWGTVRVVDGALTFSTFIRKTPALSLAYW